MRSRHKRHLRLLESLKGMCWRVEVCHTRVRSHAAGVAGTVNTLTGRHLFWRFNDLQHGPTATPPFAHALEPLVFVVTRILPPYAPSASDARVVYGWQGLAKFARDRFEEGK